jgi:hypothetical protein
MGRVPRYLTLLKPDPGGAPEGGSGGGFSLGEGGELIQERLVALYLPDIRVHQSSA